MLNTAPNLQDPDGFYQALIDTHHGLDTPQSHTLNACLVLLLANHIGHPDTLRQALQTARETVLNSPPKSTPPTP